MPPPLRPVWGASPLRSPVPEPASFVPEPTEREGRVPPYHNSPNERVRFFLDCHTSALEMLRDDPITPGDDYTQRLPQHPRLAATLADASVRLAKSQATVAKHESELRVLRSSLKAERARATARGRTWAELEARCAERERVLEEIHAADTRSAQEGVRERRRREARRLGRELRRLLAGRCVACWRGWTRAVCAAEGHRSLHQGAVAAMRGEHKGLLAQERARRRAHVALLLHTRWHDRRRCAAAALEEWRSKARSARWRSARASIWAARRSQRLAFAALEAGWMSWRCVVLGAARAAAETQARSSAEKLHGWRRRGEGRLLVRRQGRALKRAWKGWERQVWVGRRGGEAAMDLAKVDTLATLARARTAEAEAALAAAAEMRIHAAEMLRRSTRRRQDARIQRCALRAWGLVACVASRLTHRIIKHILRAGFRGWQRCITERARQAVQALQAECAAKQTELNTLGALHA
jgi:uncharacterized coiled-coil protein SlyX